MNNSPSACHGDGPPGSPSKHHPSPRTRDGQELSTSARTVPTSPLMMTWATLTAKQPEMTIPNASLRLLVRLLMPSFSLDRFVSFDRRCELYLPLSSRTARLTKARLAHVTSHPGRPNSPNSTSWWGPVKPGKQQESRPERRAQLRPGRQRREYSMIASARHPADQPRPARGPRRRNLEVRDDASMLHPAAH